ncbi:hypothetical protein DTO166G4_6884 [Paecilomyces variotii]|nr:hypothetical protein DTO166G4_6884 [Paecilomyces variotii]KAJ9232015.1 hypothetical protein DTO166G5_6466 [Paecilomyces variotii]KAJ9246520.1 hypothetical protein DTO207G8_8874 [Paecilomyces variotii]KAJ9264449.1 hypothetical protein DTO195F2_2266 [Paecilomyces variotii]KAJ9358863.1 hypothetical protein DTO027B9_2158 [Paecilomyces variotii]
MTFNITIDHSSPHDSDRSSLSDEEDSSGVQVSPPSIAGSHDYHDPYDDGGEWAHLPYPDELKPSDSASRPRTHAFHGSRSASRRNPRRRDVMHERESYSRRTRRHHSPPPPASPESSDSADEYEGGYAHAPQDRRYWPPVAHAPPTGYAHSTSSGPSYNPYNQGAVPHGALPHGAFPYPGGPHPPPASDQLVRLGHLGGHPPQYAGSPPYGYGSQFPHVHSPPTMSPYFGHEHHADYLGHHVHRPPPPHSHHSHHQAAHPRGRRRAHSPPEHAMSHTVPPPAAAPYGAPPFGPSDMVPYGHPGYLQYNNPYQVVPGMPPPPYFNPYPRVSPPPRAATTPSATSEADTAKDEAIARLEKLILDERLEREAREAARQEAIEREAAERAAREERAAAEKKIADEAAAKAAAEAKAEAEKKAAEEAEKAKKAAEEAAAAAAAEAAAAATEAANAAAEERIAAAAAAASAAANQPPPEKKKPIKFKDAVGRKFSFPFHLCCTWQGMEELIRQAFLHVEVIGPHVAEGHYDLVGPNGDIILPQVWETVVEPDWTITMHMWPIPEKPKTPEPPPPPPPPPPPEPVADDNAIVTVVEEPKKAESTGPKKQRVKAPDPGAFAMWMVGGSRARAIKSLKAAKKPEVL